MSVPFIEENDQTKARQEHLDALRLLVTNAYPNKFERSHTVDPQLEDSITTVVEKYRSFGSKTAEGGQVPPEAVELANQQLNKPKVRLAGRVASPPRIKGKTAFVHLSDGVTRLQVYLRRDGVKAVNNATGSQIEEEDKGWELLRLLDHGDFIGVGGYLFITKTGELTVHVEQVQFLAKALLPMPHKIHGISDSEVRRRQRYVDLIAGSLKVDLRKEDEDDVGTTTRPNLEELTPRQVFERRAKVIREMRTFLDEHGYVEVETPMLTPLATGAAAKPFETYHNALRIPLYARIAPELYLKRLLVGGFEKVYELNRNFRNEGISSRHNPEFTMLEFYLAYADVNQMMDFCEQMLAAVVFKVSGGLEVKFKELSRELVFLHRQQLPKEITIDFGKFERLTIKKAIIRHVEGRVADVIEEDLQALLEDGDKAKVLLDFLWWLDNEYINLIHGEDGTGAVIWSASDNEAFAIRQNKWKKLIESSPGKTSDQRETAKTLMALFEDFVEGELKQPTFITAFPKAVSPLSKADPSNVEFAERFELFIAGMECANGFSELNDPAEQYQRFIDQVSQRERGDEEAMVMDEDYIRALSYGMPPAAGIGIGIDRFTMLLTNKQSIRDVILFPHMRPERKASEQGESKESTG